MGIDVISTDKRVHAISAVYRTPNTKKLDIFSKPPEKGTFFEPGREDPSYQTMQLLGYFESGAQTFGFWFAVLEDELPYKFKDYAGTAIKEGYFERIPWGEAHIFGPTSKIGIDSWNIGRPLPEHLKSFKYC